MHNPGVLAVLPREDPVAPEFILGVLNSRSASVAFAQLAPKAKKGLFPKVIITAARRLPFPRIDVSSQQDRRQHDVLLGLVDQMLALRVRADHASAPQDRADLERRLASLDSRVDEAVYGLYGLTSDEIDLVEESVPHAGCGPEKLATTSAHESQPLDRTAFMLEREIQQLIEAAIVREGWQSAALVGFLWGSGIMRVGSGTPSVAGNSDTVETRPTSRAHFSAYDWQNACTHGWRGCGHGQILSPHARRPPLDGRQKRECSVSRMAD